MNFWFPVNGDENSVDPDQLVSSEASWSGSTLFSENIIEFYKSPNEPWHGISNNEVCATSKASDQPAQMRSLIRAFASRLNILRLLSYWLNIFLSF